MVFSSLVAKARFTLANNKIQRWRVVPQRQLEEFMQVADRLNELMEPENHVKAHFKQYKIRREQSLLATSDFVLNDKRTDLMVCVNTALNDLSGFILLAQDMFIKPYDLIEEAKQAQAMGKMAKIRLESIRAVEEFFKANETFIEKMFTLKTILETLQQEDEGLSSPHVTHYLIQLNEFLSAYQDLNLIGCINNSSTPTEAIIGLNEKISSQQFQRFAICLSELAFIQESIRKRLRPYEENRAQDLIRQQSELTKSYVRLDAYSLIPVQHIPRLRSLLLAVESEFNKELQLDNIDINLPLAIQSVKESIVATSKLVRDYDTRVDQREITKAQCAQLAIEKMSGKYAAQRKITLLKAILDLNLNNKLEQKGAIEVAFFDTYLKNLLVRAYPKDFSFQSTLFCINRRGSLSKSLAQYQQLLAALGVSGIKNEMVLNTDQFNASQLDELFQRDQNPLWLVLKSTIPVSQQFGTTQKIMTYIDLANQFCTKKMGSKGKYLGAFAMAMAAYAVETHDADDIALIDLAFQPFVSDEANKELCKGRRFGNWIVAKHQEHAKSRDRQDIGAEISTELKSRSQSLSEAALVRRTRTSAGVDRVSFFSVPSRVIHVAPAPQITEINDDESPVVTIASDFA